MLGELFEHVVEKPDAGRDLGRAGAVELDPPPDLRLPRIPLDHRDPHTALPNPPRTAIGGALLARTAWCRQCTCGLRPLPPLPECPQKPRRGASWRNVSVSSTSSSRAANPTETRRGRFPSASASAGGPAQRPLPNSGGRGGERRTPTSQKPP